MIHLDDFGGHVFKSKAAPPMHNDKVTMEIKMADTEEYRNAIPLIKV